MLNSLHKQATTTPRIRAEIQASTEPAWIVGQRFGISEQTVWKWRKRVSASPHAGIQQEFIDRTGAEVRDQL